jgi:predicted RecB family nuclease
MTSIIEYITITGNVDIERQDLEDKVIINFVPKKYENKTACCHIEIPEDRELIREDFYDKVIFHSRPKKIEYDEKKIYAFCGPESGKIYKLHDLTIGDIIFAWIDISSSNVFASGIFSCAKDALKKHSGELHVFDSQKDFLKWAYENA